MTLALTWRLPKPLQVSVRAATGAIAGASHRSGETALVVRRDDLPPPKPSSQCPAPDEAAGRAAGREGRPSGSSANASPACPGHRSQAHHVSKRPASQRFGLALWSRCFSV